MESAQHAELVQRLHDTQLALAQQQQQQQQQQQLQAMGYSGILDNVLMGSQPLSIHQQIHTSQAQQHLPSMHPPSSEGIGGCDSSGFLQLHQQLGGRPGGFDPSVYTIPESLAHSGLLSAALSDPMGSLSHIDFGLLSGSPPKPFGCSTSPPTSSPLALPMTPVTTGLSLGGHGTHSPFKSTSILTKHEEMKRHQAVAGGGGAHHHDIMKRSSDFVVEVKHPEVGDAIGDGRLSHEDVIAHFRQYALRVGFSMTRNFDNMDGSGRYRRVRVACKQGGMPRKTTKHENPALQRERTSQKVGCPFEVTIWRTKQRPGGGQSTVEQWIVTNVKGICHGPCQLLGGAYHPLSKTHDGIHKDVQEEIKAQLKRTQAATAAAANPVGAATSAAAVPQPKSANKKPKLDQKCKKEKTTGPASSSAAPSVASPTSMSPPLVQSDGTQTPGSRGASPPAAVASSPSGGGAQPIMSLVHFVSSRSALLPDSEVKEFVLLLGEIADAGKRISEMLSSPGAASDLGGTVSFASQAMRDAIASTTSSSGSKAFSAVVATASPHGGDEATSETPGLGSSRYTVFTDPLSGITAMDAGSPPGTTFAVSRTPSPWSPGDRCLQEGRNLLVAGYLIYSTATMMVLTVGDGTHGFTLDRRTGDFLLTHPSMRVPARSQSYALGESCEGVPEQWPGGVESYIETIAHGNGQSKKPYVARCASSVVADLHRALLRGGVVLCPPGSRLCLVHAAAPLALLAEQANGRAIDGGCRRVLEAAPQTLGQTTDLYLGSADDVSELELHLREV